MGMNANVEVQNKRIDAACAQQFQRQLSGFSSLYQVESQRGAKAYRYDVVVRSIVEGRNGKVIEKELSRGVDDGQRSLNRQFCSALVKIAIGKSKFFGLIQPGGPAPEYVYDQKSTFYTVVRIEQAQIVKIKMQAKPAATSHASHADYELLRQYHGSGVRFEVHLHPSTFRHLLDLNDLEQYVAAGAEPLLSEDRSVRTFIELAVAQHAINTGRYTPIGAGKLFELEGQQSQRLGNGIVLRTGVMKGVRAVQSGTSGTAQLALVLDVKSSPFFASQTVASTVEEVMNWVARVGRGQQHGDWDVVSRMLDGVRLRTNYGEKYRTFVFGRLTAGPVAQMSITDRDGRRTTIAGYFRDTYGITLRNAQLPGVVPTNAKVGDDGQLGPVYPMELLIVLSDQRVPLEKLDSRMVDVLLNANSLRPEQRARLIQQHAEQLDLFSPRNTVLQSSGLAIDSRPTSVNINVRQLPTLRFGQQRTVQPSADKANWTKEAQRFSYLQTQSVASWLVLHPERDSELVEEFADRLFRAMQQKGMRFAEPELASYPRYFGESVFRDALHAYPKVEFIMLVSPKFDDTHNMLKYLEAITRRVVTQQVALETVRRLVDKNQRLTLDNIVNKLNLKNYGLNYASIVEPAASAFDLSSGELLVLGYDVSHPSPASAQERFKMREQGVKDADSLDPSVVGISANSAADPQAFVGEYFYQASRKEAVDTRQLAAHTARILRALKENRPQASLPRYVVVLRDGISEGQYLMAMREELAAIQHGIQLFDRTYSPKLLFVVCTKRHNKKFFAVDQQGRVDNLPPGSVIQGVGVTRPDCVEFFMQSHYPLKGTGKTVEYTVLHDGIGISQDQLQGLLNTCCFSHQIVMSAVSLPEPVYQADELAKRGNNNLKTYRRMNRGIPRLPNGLPDHEHLNRLLSITGSRLSGTRFTA